MVRYLGIYEDICGRKRSVTTAVNGDIELQINQRNTYNFFSQLGLYNSHRVNYSKILFSLLLMVGELAIRILFMAW